MTRPDPAVKTRAVRAAAPPVRKAVSPLIARLASKAGALDPALVRDWAEIVGPDLAAYCRPIKIRQRGRAGALVIAASNGAMAMRLQYAQVQILPKVQAYLGTRVTAIAIEQTARKGPRWRSQHVRGADVVPADPDVAASGPIPKAASVEEALAALKAAMRDRGR